MLMKSMKYRTAQKMSLGAVQGRMETNPGIHARKTTDAFLLKP